jgi:hypothetical protein
MSIFMEALPSPLVTQMRPALAGGTRAGKAASTDSAVLTTTPAVARFGARLPGIPRGTPWFHQT